MQVHWGEVVEAALEVRKGEEERVGVGLVEGAAVQHCCSSSVRSNRIFFIHKIKIKFSKPQERTQKLWVLKCASSLQYSAF